MYRLSTHLDVPGGALAAPHAALPSVVREVQAVRLAAGLGIVAQDEFGGQLGHTTVFLLKHPQMVRSCKTQV